MPRAVFRSIRLALWQPSVIVPSAITTALAFTAFRVLHVERDFLTWPIETMTAAAAIVVARFWASLVVIASALRVMRRGFVRAPVYWVPPTRTFQAGFVSLVLVLPILALTVFFIVPGVWLALRWSQAAMLIVDEQAEWFDAADLSVDMTAGRKLDILAIWLLTALAAGVTSWLGAGLGSMAAAAGAPSLLAEAPSLLARLVIDAAGLVMTAAIFHELEPERP